jgi:carbonic anhydrase
MRTIAILAVLGMASMATNGTAPIGPATAHASPAYQVDETKVESPADALEALIAGNQRFVNGTPLNHDYHRQIAETADGQQPYATILSCLDSRVPPEIIFDQGIGDVFVGRVAGNIEDINILGSIEFAKEVVGTKLLVVLGHTSCGAVKGACQDVKLDNLTHLLSEIRPAVAAVEAQHPGEDVCADALIDLVAEENVRDTISDIRARSQIITDLESSGRLMVVGAMYDISTGKVRFFEPAS